MPKQSKYQKKLHFRPFEEAREFVRTLGLKNYREWTEYCRSGKKPEDIPSSPYQIYKGKGWKGLGDFLGTGTIAPQNMEYRSFEEAREFVRTLGLKNKKEWDEYSEENNMNLDATMHGLIAQDVKQALDDVGVDDEPFEIDDDPVEEE